MRVHIMLGLAIQIYLFTMGYRLIKLFISIESYQFKFYLVALRFMKRIRAVSYPSFDKKKRAVISDLKVMVHRGFNIYGAAKHVYKLHSFFKSSYFSLGFYFF